jgi:hypothetical protein
VVVGLTISGASPSPAASVDRYADADDLYTALGNQPHSRLLIGGGQIDVVFADGAPGLDRGRVMHWIRAGAQAVTTYFGHFPVAHVGVLVIATDGAQVSSGTTYGFDGSAIHIAVGRNADETVLRDDWILVHEMTHLALPTVPRRSLWLLEGNATYVEPIARAQAGQIDPAVVWRWSLEGMPKGLPQQGDRGLDHTASWGRTYWGGAMFWLLADIRIRERTQNRQGVQDALRAINRASRGNGTHWSVDQIMAVGDQATRTDVMATLYAQMKEAPVETNLRKLFVDLGVTERDGEIIFEERAPLAALRRAITAAPND